MNNNNNVKYKILKEISIMVISLIIGIIITFGVSISSYAQRVSNEITESVIRFHVIADSNTEEDQTLKLKVRDSLLKYLSKEMNGFENRKQAEDYILSHIDDINAVAERVIKSEGYDYSVNTDLSIEQYPVRYYKNAVFPSGKYTSLRVIIGSGEGHNWWCVMYPPLCLNGEGVEYKDLDILKNVLSKDGYDVVVLSSEEVVPEFKFKIVEWWSSLNKD